MSPVEAAALLNIDLQEDLEDQLELVIFELKQKIYRQLDQLLLYPKWFKEIEKIDRAAKALAVKWSPSKQNETTLLNPKPKVNDHHLPMLVLFNQHQLQRKEMALRFHQAQAPIQLEMLLKAWLEIQKQYVAYWSKIEVPSTEVQLTAQFDPQVMFLTLQELKEKDVLFVQDLNRTAIPEKLQAYIAWHQKIWSKLQAA
ncbi:MAG: hypothetical protein RL331_647 [Bacteroidota bacterium]|jgi:hypothetical protein